LKWRFVAGNLGVKRNNNRGETSRMADIRIRQGVHNLDDAHVADFRNSYRQLMGISDNRGYQYLAGLHGVPGYYCWHHQHNDRAARNMQIFLPWHRAYLYNWEMGMRDRVPGVTLPWWDWTLGPPRQNGLPTVFAERNGADGQPNPLLGFRINLPQARPALVRTTSRSPGSPDDLPTQSDVDDCLSRTDWMDFCDKLEDVHDRVHGWVSGDMGLVGTSAFDPIFWSHHAMIDRIWWLWQARNGNGNIPADLVGQVLAPFNMQVRDVLNVHDLGYEYGAAQSVVPIGGTS
jgi:tyrosinase